MRALPFLPSRSSRHGGALILALLFMGLIATGFATWVTVIRQRARTGDLMEHQANKRLAAANATILVRDYLLRRTIASNGDDDGLSTGSAGAGVWSATTQSSWSGDSLASTAAWTVYPLDSSSRMAGLNGFSPTFDYPYAKSLTFTDYYRQLSFVNEVEQFPSDSTTVRGYVRSRNLLLGGDLLILHRPSVNVTTVAGAALSPLPPVTGNVAVYGRVLHFAPDITAASYTARSSRFTAPAAISGGTPSTVNITPKALDSTNLPWSNLPWTPLSCGSLTTSNLESTASGDDWRWPDFTGQLNFIDSSTTNPSNNLRAELIAAYPNTTIQPAGTAPPSDASGITISGGIARLTPYTATSTMKNVILSETNGISEIIIEGQTGADFTNAQYTPAVGIVYTQSATGTNLTTVRLRNYNNRRLLLALKKDPRATTMAAVNVIVETTATNAAWHCLILCENVPLTFTYPNLTTLQLYGGIETNSALIFPDSPKSCEINLETDTRGLNKMSPRLSWVETYLTGKL